MFSAPWTEIGTLQSAVRTLESQMHGKADSYELSSLRNSVDSLERTTEELRSSLTELRFELQNAQDTIRELKEDVE